MIKVVKKTSIYFLLPLISFVLLKPVSASINDYSDAVNKSGKQRMLTQRMLNDFVQMGMGIDFGKPSDDLKSKIKLFDDTLSDLKSFNKNSEINKSINQIEESWSPIKKMLELKAKKEEMPDLHKKMNALLKLCGELTGMFVKSSGKGNVEIINISGRQRMLSQRLAALYMLKVWGVDEPELKHELKQAMDEFSKAQTALEQSKYNTKEINSRLATVKKSFKWFELMSASTSGRFAPSLISKSSKTILVEMDAVTNLYIKEMN